MPGAILHVGATVLCAHGGQAMPTAPASRVLVGGQPVATMVSPYSIAGCSFPPQAGGPCATGQWTVGATRVMAMSQPVAIQTGTATCVPTGTPMTASVVQSRVLAT